LWTVENEFWCLIYKLLFPNVEIWRIGDRLRISPSHRVRGVDRKQFNIGEGNPFENLQSLTGRYLYKARFMVLNAERGTFPKIKKVELPENYSPFEELKSKGYLNSTTGKDNDESQWIKWLRRQFENELKTEIARRNNLEDWRTSNNFKIRKRFDDFVLGKDDLI